MPLFPKTYWCNLGGGASARRFAQAGHAEACRKLLAHPATDPNLPCTDDGCSPLVVAAFLGRAACVGLLLLHPATDPNSADALDGTTPLLAAATAGHADVASCLG